MRRHRRSYIASFFYGILIASGTALGLMATHHWLAPPGDEVPGTPASQVKTIAEVAAGKGIERFARKGEPAREAAQPAPAPDPKLVSEPKPASPPAKLVAGPTVVQPPKALTVDAPRQAGTGESQRMLARNIQRELKRVGCFTGDADGEWSSATRAAMRTFNDSVRVQLPVTAPDYILLTLLQGHASRACGRPDPSITAKASPSRPAADPVVEVPTPRRVTVIQPRPSVPATPPGNVAVQPSPSQQTQPIATQTAAPLPGRMAIGAPPPPEAAAPAPPRPVERAAVTPPERPAPPRTGPRQVERKPTYQAPFTPPRQARAPGAAPRQGTFVNLQRDAP